MSDEKPAVTEIRPEDEVAGKGIFGIAEAPDGSIWFGTFKECVVMMGIPLPTLNGKRCRNNYLFEMISLRATNDFFR